MSKHGPHPFEWDERGYRGTHQNPLKNISFELPTFSLSKFIALRGMMLRIRIFGRTTG